MGFSNTASAFGSGVILDKKHLSTRIKEHKKSDVHISSTNAILRYDMNLSIDDRLDNEQYQDQLRLSNMQKNGSWLKELLSGFWAN